MGLFGEGRREERALSYLGDIFFSCLDLWGMRVTFHCACVGVSGIAVFPIFFFFSNESSKFYSYPTMPNRKSKKTKSKKVPTHTKRPAPEEQQLQHEQQKQEEQGQPLVDVRSQEERISPAVQAAIDAIVSFSCIDMLRIMPRTASDTPFAPKDTRATASLPEELAQAATDATGASVRPASLSSKKADTPSTNKTCVAGPQPKINDTQGPPTLPADAVEAAIEAVVLAGSVAETQASPSRRYSCTSSVVVVDDVPKHPNERPDLLSTSSSSFVHLSHPPPPPPQRGSSSSSQHINKALPPVPKEKDSGVKRPDPAHSAPLPASQINPHSRQLPPPPLSASRLNEEQQRQQIRDNQKCIIL